MKSAHRHDTVEVNFAEDGELLYLFGGTPVQLPPGFVSVFWGITPHQLVQCPQEVTMHWLTIPLSMVVTWGLPDDFMQLLFQGRPLVSTQGSTRHEDSLRLRRWAQDLASQSPYDRLTAELEIQARLRRLAPEVQPTPAGQQISIGNLRLRRVADMAAFIARSFAEPIQASDVAAAVHLHPNYAMGLFSRVTGSTINHYLVQCRVAEAQRLLLTTDVSIGDILHQSGFQSQSQFYASFASVCGETPSSYRRHSKDRRPT